MLKRHKLIKLSKEVLDARCPSFCTQARLTDDGYLREASHALANIIKDVDDAACANEVTKASAKRYANGTVQPQHVSLRLPRTGMSVACIRDDVTVYKTR